jgi:hypothetical protein
MKDDETIEPIDSGAEETLDDEGPNSTPPTDGPEPQPETVADAAGAPEWIHISVGGHHKWINSKNGEETHTDPTAMTPEQQAADHQEEIDLFGPETPGDLPGVSWRERKTPIPDDTPHAGALADTESGLGKPFTGGKNLGHKKDRDGGISGGAYGIRGDVAPEIVQADPVLKQKYGNLVGMSFQAWANLLNHDHDLDDDLMRSRWGRVLEQNGGDPHRAYIQWNSGLGGLKRYDRIVTEGSDKPQDIDFVSTVKENVKHFDSYMAAREPGSSAPPAPAATPPPPVAGGAPAPVLAQQGGGLAAAAIAGAPSLPPANRTMKPDLKYGAGLSEWQKRALTGEGSGTVVPLDMGKAVAGAEAAKAAGLQPGQIRVLEEMPRKAPGTAEATDWKAAAPEPQTPGPINPQTELHLETPAAGTEPTPAAAMTPADQLRGEIDRRMQTYDAALENDARVSSDMKKSIDAKIAEIGAGKIDPAHFFASRSSAARILSVIAQGLGAAGAAISHGPNAAAEMLQHAMDSDIAAQKASLDSKHTALGEMIKAAGSYEEGVKGMRMLQYEAIKALVDELGKGGPTGAGMGAGKMAGDIAGLAGTLAQIRALEVQHSKLGVFSGVQAQLPADTPGVGDPNAVNYARNAQLLVAETLHNLSGATVSDKERAYLEQLIPSAGTTKGTAAADFKALEDWVSRKFRMLNEAAKKTYGRDFDSLAPAQQTAVKDSAPALLTGAVADEGASNMAEE